MKWGIKKTTSYERYRETYNIDGVELVIDKFPFGYILEIEGEKEKILSLADKLGLDKDKVTGESCDDIYERLCGEVGLTPKKDIEFSDPDMPKL